MQNPLLSGRQNRSLEHASVPSISLPGLRARQTTARFEPALRIIRSVSNPMAAQAARDCNKPCLDRPARRPERK